MRDLSLHTAVIVDEHPLWLDALESLLERLDLHVVGRATRATDATHLITEHRPDVVVTDIAMTARGINPAGPSMLTHAREQNENVRCIVLSQEDDPQERERAFAEGASVFCIKRTGTDDLATAIRQSFDHSIYFSQGARPPVELAESTATDGPVITSLTKREFEILRLVAEGHSNSRLAQMLWVTEQTVKFHLSNVYRKLNVANRTEASRWAQVNGVLDLREREPRVA
jgi:DNA-binding NarL/FixJ family response regulator